MKAAGSQASGLGFLAFSGAPVLPSGGRGGRRLHSGSATKSNIDTRPTLKLKCQVHLASLSFQTWTLAVRQPTHYLPDINLLVPADARRFYGGHQQAVFNRSLIPPTSQPINQRFNSPTHSGISWTKKMGSACFYISG